VEYVEPLPNGLVILAVAFVAWVWGAVKLHAFTLRFARRQARRMGVETGRSPLNQSRIPRPPDHVAGNRPSIGTRRCGSNDPPTAHVRCGYGDEWSGLRT
jgi:hypothetical protein